jgi:hypothetical protein
VTSLRNVSVKLVYPKAAFRLVEGREAVNYTALEGRRRIEWVLRAIYEGEWSLSLNVTSSGGALVVERAINVTLPPVVPRVVVPRIFNVTVSCVDLRGRPLASYLVNLYDNATRALVASGFTNASGLVRFANVTAGAYQLEVTDGLYSTRTLLLVYANRNVTVTVGLASLRVRVELADGLPLPQAAVYVRDENGSLACAGFTDSWRRAAVRGPAAGQLHGLRPVARGDRRLLEGCAGERYGGRAERGCEARDGVRRARWEAGRGSHG